MRIARQPSFILHARPWRETSLLVDALTRDHGRIGLVARGVTGPKKHALRAALQPLQHVALDYRQVGELAQLQQAEALDTAPQLSGDATLAGFYVSELLLRLLPKQDAAGEAFLAYARMRERLRAGDDLAWTLRRFERDLLRALGFGVDLDCDADGLAIEAQARYRLVEEHGLVQVADTLSARSFSGASVLALAGDMPPPESLRAELRLLLRQCIEPHLGGRELKSWGLMSQLAALQQSS